MEQPNQKIMTIWKVGGHGSQLQNFGWVSIFPVKKWLIIPTMSPHFSYFLSQCGYTRNDENIYISLNVWMFYPCDFIKFLSPLSKILIWSWLISVIFIKRRQTLQSMHLIVSTNISKDTFCWKSPKAKTFLMSEYLQHCAGLGRVLQIASTLK